MIRLANGHVESIAGLGWWPKTLPADIFMREHGGKIPDGVLRTVIPAAPDAWITALERHGTMRFADVASFAQRYAAEGFAVYPLLSVSIASHEQEYRRWQSNTAVFLPNNRVPKSGEKFVQSDLAKTLQYMIDQDRAAGTTVRSTPTGILPPCSRMNSSGSSAFGHQPSPAIVTTSRFSAL
jgi:gamma-glutamyltranspeptidase/glutathione hydrolase